MFLSLTHTKQQKQNKMTTINLGNIGTKEQAEKIANKLNGKTFMNFQVEYSSDANNWPVIVSTERPETSKKELRKMVTFVLACEL